MTTPARSLRRPKVVAKKPLRADAERNRLHVLAVAQSVFATEGLSVPIDEIARRAGLGVGTLYRHFPTKEALFLAIVQGRLRSAVLDARRLARATDAGAAFFDFITRVVEEGGAKRDFMDALKAAPGLDAQGALAPFKRDFVRALGKLVTRAQAAGSLRSDVTSADVFALVSGLHTSLERLGSDVVARARVIGIVCDGLRVASLPALPASPRQSGGRSKRSSQEDSERTTTHHLSRTDPRSR